MTTLRPVEVQDYSVPTPEGVEHYARLLCLDGESVDLQFDDASLSRVLYRLSGIPVERVRLDDSL